MSSQIKTQQCGLHVIILYMPQLSLFCIQHARIPAGFAIIKESIQKATVMKEKSKSRQKKNEIINGVFNMAK